MGKIKDNRMNDFAQVLDMKTQADLLLATREDLEKCKLKVQDITDLAIDKLYAEAAASIGVRPKNAFELLVREMKNVVHFQTGDDELDRYLGEEGLSSDEVVEVCGASASGKTYFCLKLAALAMLESGANAHATASNIACLYVDTTNYVNGGNVGLVLRNFMSQCSADEKQQRVQEVLQHRFKIQKCSSLDKLLVLLAHLVSLLKAKKYFIGIVYTNNTKDTHVSRVSELRNLVGEPISSWAVDKQIYATQ